MPKLPSEPESILIVKLSSIGDVIHALPVATSLRRRFPRARIWWLVSKKAKEIVSGHPDLDGVIVVGGDGRDGHIPIPNIEHPFVVARTLRSIHFDVALDLQGLIRSSLFAYLSGAKIRIGYRSLKEAAFLFSNVRTIRPSREMHVVDGYLRFAEALGASTKPVDFRIATTADDENRVAELLKEAQITENEKLVALSPASSWRAKTWPPERLAAVADHIASRYGMLPVIIGAKSDIRRAERILADAQCRTINLAGKTNLKELTVLLRRCELYVGNDSGPTHLAAAVGKPVVAVYGPTDEYLLSPYGKQHITIAAKVPCRPCRRRSLAERCSHLRCLKEIAPDKVCAAIDEVLARTAKETVPENN